ncbi:MAG: HAMP domain-containing histidine kinase [Rhodospirillaceae bacterium]|nr:HAMP domain-containing histidine kinase [Rhodospirillaceae bacterium]
MTAATRLPSIRRSLTTRLLLWTVAFVMLAEVLIYVPSIARFRLQALRDTVNAAHLATLAIDAARQANTMISPELVDKLLGHARSLAVVRYQDGQPRRVALGEIPQRIDATYDLRDAMFFELIWDAFKTLAQPAARPIRVRDYSPQDGRVLLDVFVAEGPIRRDMIAYSWRILAVSVIISLFAACLVYLSLHALMVRPLRRITENMTAFRDAPEDTARLMRPSGRGDEIGFAERELRTMQIGLRSALRQREHLAALGAAVTKINHDLRNALSSAQLVSDRLTDSADPQVRRVAPTMVRAIDRAVALCAQTLEYARGQEHELQIARFDLAQMVDETIQSLAPATPATTLVNDVPRPFPLAADRAELDRVVTNLLRNASQAGATRVTVGALRDGRAGVAIDVADDGPGLPAELRERLFEPFAAGRKGGTGLGLAIVRDLVQAHGGTVRVLDAATGAHFRIDLPRA